MMIGYQVDDHLWIALHCLGLASYVDVRETLDTPGPYPAVDILRSHVHS
jgi:hypothetical protein